MREVQSCGISREPFTDLNPRRLAELEKCVPEGKRSVGVVREQLCEVELDG